MRGADRTDPYAPPNAESISFGTTVCYAVVGMRSRRVLRVSSLALTSSRVLPFVAALACGFDDRSVLAQRGSSDLVPDASEPSGEAPEPPAPGLDATSPPSRDSGSDPPPSPMQTDAVCNGCLIEGT